MPYSKIQDGVIYYSRQGRGALPDLVLLHGAGGNHLTWPTEIRRLPNTTVYGLDLPGHGRSPGPARNHIVDYAADVIQVISKLQLKRVVLVGYSMGGAIALTIGLQKLPQIAGLVLISSGARLRVANQFLELMNSDFAEAAAQLAKFYWAPGTSANKLEGSKEIMLEAGRDTTLADFKACNDFDMMAECSQINTPSLIISGTADQLTPPKYARYLLNQLSKARLVEVPGTAHMVFLEKPILVSEAISSFLEALVKDID